MADSVVDIDPDGDVVLVCGKANGSERLRVSSKVLSLASPVFKTMLGPNFKEGKKLSELGTLDLPLPDDDGADMMIICNILHMRHSKLDRRLEVKKLEDVSILADKYNCTMALGPIAEHWVRELRTDCSDATRASLICSAFRLRLPMMFKELGRDHILRYNGHWVLDGNRPEHKVLQKVLDAADQETCLARIGVVQFFDERIVCYCDTNRTYANNCNRALMYGTDMLRKLKGAELWPLYSARGLTIGSMLSKMASMSWKQASLGVANCGNRNTMGNACFCTLSLWIDNKTLATLFKAEAERIRKKIPDLCLGCVLEGEKWKKTDCNHSEGPSLPFGI
ncbi:hypothetical protein CBER1_01434 [Cercospora berteroae]|uniref:BTB domain-containing protein n=1 Tax=Cercospora berteroae TaxID=357750 RepID=A0A2S6CCD1_9PEZI|nr:hypothetical protein CBER1_01434 [Cercospora berteroae]